MEQKVNILIVDDSPLNLELLEAMLDCPEYELKKATSGQEAVEILQDQDFALVLMDVQMPGIDGYEAAGEIRAMPQHEHLPIIFVTATRKDPEWVQKGYRTGAVDYLFKPLEPEILKGKVHVFVHLFKEKQKLKNLSMHDEVTGLYNRREFFVMAKQQMKHATQSTNRMLLLAVHVSGFNFIAESCGVEESNEALAKVADVIRKTVSESDIQGAIAPGGFAILTSEAFGSSTADILKMRLRDNLEDEQKENPGNFTLQLDIGTVAVDPTIDVALEELLSEAEYLVTVDKMMRDQ